MAKIPAPQETEKLSTEEILNRMSVALDAQLQQVYEDLAQNNSLKKPSDQDPKFKI
jgi:hypothetical protein